MRFRRTRTCYQGNCREEWKLLHKISLDSIAKLNLSKELLIHFLCRPGLALSRTSEWLDFPLAKHKIFSLRFSTSKCRRCRRAFDRIMRRFVNCARSIFSFFLLSYSTQIFSSLYSSERFFHQSCFRRRHQDFLAAAVKILKTFSCYNFPRWNTVNTLCVVAWQDELAIERKLRRKSNFSDAPRFKMNRSFAPTPSRMWGNMIDSAWDLRMSSSFWFIYQCETFQINFQLNLLRRDFNFNFSTLTWFSFDMIYRANETLKVKRACMRENGKIQLTRINIFTSNEERNEWAKVFRRTFFSFSNLRSLFWHTTSTSSRAEQSERLLNVGIRKVDYRIDKFLIDGI